MKVGEVNKIIDSVLHPLARKYPYLWLLDSLLHAMVETSSGEDPRKIVIKFLRYNFPKIANTLVKELEKYEEEDG